MCGANYGEPDGDPGATMSKPTSGRMRSSMALELRNTRLSTSSVSGRWCRGCRSNHRRFAVTRALAAPSSRYCHPAAEVSHRIDAGGTASHDLRRSVRQEFRADPRGELARLALDITSPAHRRSTSTTTAMTPCTSSCPVSTCTGAPQGPCRPTDPARALRAAGRR